MGGVYCWKKKKNDVVQFGLSLMDSIVDLNLDLVNHSYRHGGYESFFISDPKRRHIHKASVRDRLVHHAVYRILYPFFDKAFIADSYSCRNEKGVHKALGRFSKFSRQVSRNNTRTCWVLKCDIKQFFASIDHEILISFLQKYIYDQVVIGLLRNIVESYCTESKQGIGLPLGNLTSQLFANIYLNQFDIWVKHMLKAKYYIRYADDFVFFSEDRSWLLSIIPKIQNFLQTNLNLSLHPNKLWLTTVASGVDYLGWVHFPDHRVLRAKTRRRMFRNIRKYVSEDGAQSYLGLISHGNAHKLHEQVLWESWLWGGDRPDLG